MNIERSFYPSDRYTFDWGCCSTRNGYAQVDTSQDASYYGTWANPFERRIVTYCEGDVTVQTCDSDTEFRDAIIEMKNWTEQFGHRFLGIDCGFNCHLAHGFVTCNLGDLLH